MRIAFAFLMLAGTLATALPARAQPVPSPSPAGSTQCTARRANLGGIGQASIVAFTGAVFHDRVCATVANLAGEAFTARIDLAAPAGTDAGLAAPLVSAALGEGGTVTLPLDGATVSGVGPYVVGPGGTFPALGSDIEAQPRVVMAYAGQRVLVIGTTPVTLIDLARVLRDQPDLFGADAVERAVVLASGARATISLHAADGTFGSEIVQTPRVLQLIKRG